jgi:hypothetical protein
LFHFQISYVLSWLFQLFLALSSTNLCFFFCRFGSLCVAGGEFEEVWTYFGCYITFPGFP